MAMRETRVDFIMSEVNQVCIELLPLVFVLVFLNLFLFIFLFIYYLLLLFFFLILSLISRTRSLISTS